MALTDHLAVALDFSDASDVALRAALALAKKASSKNVTAIHVVKPVVLPRAGGSDRLRTQVKELLDLEHRITGAARAEVDKRLLAAGAGAEVAREIASGRPADVIPEVVRAVHATMLLLGTHSRRGLARMFVGSVAESVIRGLGDLPAMVIPSREDGVAAQAIEALDHVLIAVDLGGPDPSQVIEAGVELLRAYRHPQGRATVLYSLDTPSMQILGADASDVMMVGYRQELLHGAEAELERLLARFSNAGVPIDGRVLDGPVVDAILETALHVGAEAIVVGARGGKEGRVDLGSTAAAVMRESVIPVLVVPAHPGGAAGERDG